MDNFQDILSESSFKANKDNFIGTEFIYKAQTTSTNIDAKELGLNNGLSGAVIIASAQSQGRGRLGRDWEGANDKDIYMSFLLRLGENKKYAPLMTLISALCVADTVKALSGIDALIKWPNDVVANGKKLCGILCESMIVGDDLDFVVTGIGINVNRNSFSADIKDKASSMFLETGKNFERAPIINQLVYELNKRYKLLTEFGIESFLPDYKKICANLGKVVNISEKGVNYTAKAVDITGEGHLVIENELGERREILSGEVSVRGIYGYV